MFNAVRRIFLACLLATLAACASGPKYNEVKSAIPTIPAEQGRIYVYRSGIMFGAGIQPSVMLNSEKVGDSKPGGFFFLDRAPGNYELLLSSEVDKKVSFTLEKGQTQYVKMTVGMGVIVYRVYPELVDATQGQTDMQDLSYTGAPLPAAK
jgi:hypothetical protein